MILRDPVGSLAPPAPDREAEHTDSFGSTALQQYAVRAAGR
jgi:hypothetical protein